MRYDNNQRLRGYLDRGAAGAYREHMRHPRFEIDGTAFAATLNDVRAQHPSLTDDEAQARAVFRLLTTGAPPEVAVPLPSPGYRARAWIRRTAPRALPWVKVLWAIAVLALCAIAAHAEPDPPGMRAIRNAMAGWPAQIGQPNGLVIQFQNGGTVLATRPAGLVALNCSTNMTCSFSGYTLTLTAAAGGGSSGTVSGQANGVVPLGTTATSITQQSHLDDGITLAGRISSVEPLSVRPLTYSPPSAGNADLEIGANVGQTARLSTFSSVGTDFMSNTYGIYNNYVGHAHTGGVLYGIDNFAEGNYSSAQDDIVGQRSTGIISGTGGSVVNVFGSEGLAITSGSSSAYSAYGNYTDMSFNSTGTVTNAFEFYGVMGNAAMSGTTTNLYGFYADHPQLAASNVTNQYGFYAPQLTEGTSLNYAFYSAGTTPSSFGGPVTVGSLKTSNLVISSTAPTISSGFGTGAAVTANNGTAAFRVSVGTSNTGTGVIGLPAAATGWNCNATNITTKNTNQATVLQTASTTVSATFQNYTDVMGTHAMTDNDVLAVSCFAY